MTASELQQVMEAAGVGRQMGTVRGSIVDMDYDLPAEGFVAGNLAAAMGRNLKRLGAGEYVEQSNDCDDFALLTAALVRLDHRLSTNRKTGLAFGIVHYFPELKPGEVMRSGHAINFFVTRTGLVFFEPQTMAVVNLTQDEIESICFYYV